MVIINVVIASASAVANNSPAVVASFSILVIALAVEKYAEFVGVASSAVIVESVTKETAVSVAIRVAASIIVVSGVVSSVSVAMVDTVFEPAIVISSVHISPVASNIVVSCDVCVALAPVVPSLSAVVYVYVSVVISDSVPPIVGCDVRSVENCVIVSDVTCVAVSVVIVSPTVESIAASDRSQ